MKWTIGEIIVERRAARMGDGGQEEYGGDGELGYRRQ
jgi:hypothetical protein